ncbi:NAD(P)H-dependent oxidoreductase [Lactiplantibacillus garii]|uniref:NAD(P)H-dependent oxidoreductase n=1 Tax=Lactiplantibacillus garii TaxID=2306423 RepID=A0A426D782_9LACO|nr:NADPH-dependent FMN reductase [Lactiplantibacillus garii]RRK10447.1 NAD(P)H-dependent oxidoreductase [Lactiplantibacillus garii]
MKLVGIVGTNATQSTNRQLLQYMQRHFADQAGLEICEIVDLPAFNEPEQHVAPAAVQTLSDAISAADGVIFATPEYDHSIPAALKSAIEWLSYTTRPLINKPVMIVGASNGSLGTSRAQAHLRQILEAPELKALVMPNVEYLLGHSLQAFDANGDLVDADKRHELDQAFNEFVAFVGLTEKLTPTETFFEQSRQFSWSQITNGEDL